MRYTPQNTGPNAQVLLDGEPVKGDFVMVDDEEHIAEVFVRQPDGRLMADHLGNVMTKILHGNYTVRNA